MRRASGSHEPVRYGADSLDGVEENGGLGGAVLGGLAELHIALSRAYGDAIAGPRARLDCSCAGCAAREKSELSGAHVAR